MKILLSGDSYGLPRFGKNSLKVALSYEETYPEVLRRLLQQAYEEDVMLVSRCRHANTSFSLVREETGMLALMEPDHAVVQLGLADLWPSSWRNVPPLQPELQGKDPWVSDREYQEHLSLFCRAAGDQRVGVVLVNIACLPGLKGEAGLKIKARINTYNDILAALVQKHPGLKLVDLHQMTAADPEFFGDDGIHLNGLGSSLLAVEIFQSLAELERQRI